MADEFLTTRWSLVFAAAEEDAPAASAAMEQLCRDAWRPLYAFARRWGCTREDAEDAVQGFIASVLSRQSFGQLEAGRGRFRSFLLAGMRNHLSDLHAKANAAKRGGGALHFSLDAEAAEQGYASFAAGTESPERTFDRVWAMTILERARQKLGFECAASGKGAVFAALFPDSDATPTEPYATLGSRLGITESALRTLTMRLRRRWRELIRSELAQTVGSRETLDEEMACLQAALMD